MKLPKKVDESKWTLAEWAELSWGIIVVTVVVTAFTLHMNSEVANPPEKHVITKENMEKVNKILEEFK